MHTSGRSGSGGTMQRIGALLALLLFSATGCGPAQPAVGTAGSTAASALQAPPERTLVAEVRTEPASLAARPVNTVAYAGNAMVQRISNADLTLLDGSGTRSPYLAEALPQLDTASWTVAADGSMETTWRLRPGIVWQDGVPFSADDFVFAWQVYRTPILGGGTPLMRAMAEVVAPDDRTVLIRWNAPYPNADDLTGTDGFPPLPRHILGATFAQGDMDAFPNNPFWSREYVGLGPYHLEQWEPGSFIEAVAFDQHILGRPKIARVKVLFIGDVNTGLANL